MRRWCSECRFIGGPPQRSLDVFFALLTESPRLERNLVVEQLLERAHFKALALVLDGQKARCEVFGARPHGRKEKCLGERGQLLLEVVCDRIADNARTLGGRVGLLEDDIDADFFRQESLGLKQEREPLALDAPHHAQIH